jgi:hypothetical protein
MPPSAATLRISSIGALRWMGRLSSSLPTNSSCSATRPL